MTLLLSHKPAANLSAQPIRIIIGFLPAGKPGNKQHFPWRHRTRAENWALRTPTPSAHIRETSPTSSSTPSATRVGWSALTLLPPSCAQTASGMPRLLSSLSSITSYKGWNALGGRGRPGIRFRWREDAVGAGQRGRAAELGRGDEGPRVRSAADREGVLQELAAGAGMDLEGRMRQWHHGVRRCHGEASLRGTPDLQG
jgi:hypothetical protein